MILPVFFKFTRLPDSDLTRKLEDLCRRAGAGVKGIYEWGLAARTRRANAALVGWGATRRVVLSDTLLDKFTPSEVEVILAHELGHHRLGHQRALLLTQTALTFVAFLLADIVFGLVGTYFELSGPGDLAGMPLLVLTFMGVGLAALPLSNYISRSLEKQADFFALGLTGLVGSFISAMERLAVLNLAETDPHPLVEWLFYSHPSTSKRIDAAKDFLHRHMVNTDEVH